MRISLKRLYKFKSEIPQNLNTNLDIMEKIREYLAVKIVTEIKRNKGYYTELAYEVRAPSRIQNSILM